MVNVLKANGEKEVFSEEKLRDSIKRAGIPKTLENGVLIHIKTKLYENIPTAEVYKHIVEFLDKSAPFTKSKYSLKQAIMDLGPSGYPFEDLVSEIFKAEGYITEVRSILTGKCVSHEIDVLMQDRAKTKKIMVEAKFHNAPGIKTDVHVALYTNARFNDLREKYDLDEAWIVTNTKITSDALDYALCSNMKIISWSYPEGKGLRDFVEKESLHPITGLNSLSNEEKRRLLDEHIILCRQILQKPENLDILSIPNDKKEKILAEAKFMTGL